MHLLLLDSSNLMLDWNTLKNKIEENIFIWLAICTATIFCCNTHSCCCCCSIPTINYQTWILPLSRLQLVWTCSHVRAHKHARACTHMRVHTHVHTHVHTCMHASTHAHTCIIRTHVHTHMHRHMYIHTPYYKKLIIALEGTWVQHYTLRNFHVGEYALLL